MQVIRESLFVSALRSFLKCFFAVCGILLAFFLLSSLYTIASGVVLIEPKTTMSVIPDAEGKREMVSATSPAILQINIHGFIGDPTVLDEKVIENILVESRTGLLANNRVKGILLHLNTPGGGAIDSDNIYRMLTAYKDKFKVPIYAYVDGLCASGGMFIASSADQIFACPSAVVGSVGVILGPFFNVYEAFGKIGVQSRTLTEGIDKDALSPFRQWKEGEDASFKPIMASLYNRFVEVVTTNRPRLDKDKLVHEYGAKVFDSVTAEKYGYIDNPHASRSDALLALLQAAEIDPAKPYQVVELEPRHEWLSQFFNGKSSLLSGKIEHSFDIGQPKIRDQFAYLYQPEGL